MQTPEIAETRDHFHQEGPERWQFPHALGWVTQSHVGHPGDWAVVLRSII